MNQGPGAVVVGGGIAGTAAAFYLVSAGARVTLIEKDAVGSHASGFAFGGLIPTAGSTSGRGLPTLSEYSFRLHRELAALLPAETGIDTGFRLKPSVMLASEPAEAESLRRSYEWFRSSHYGEARWLGTRRELDALEPRLGPAVLAALYAEMSAEVEPYRLTLALAQAAEGRGARVRHGTVSGLAVEGSHVTGVTIGKETLPASSVILAAGPWSGDAAEWLGAPLPVGPLKGQILRLRAHGPPLKAMLWWRGDYATTKSDGLVWTGTTEERVGFDDEPTAEARDRIMESAVEMLPYLGDAQLIRQTACLRPITPDGNPILGGVPGVTGVVVATGAGRNGIMLGPAMGRVAADLALGIKPACDIRGLGPERFR